MSKTYNEALLQRVEEYLASSGLSQNKMAQAVGLSQTALSNWRRKIYNGDPAYVEGKLKEYFETQAAREAVEEQAAPYLSDTGYVPTTVSEDIYKGIKFAQLERGMVVLHGDAGIGKTEGARKFLHDYPHNTVFITATPNHGLAELHHQTAGPGAGRAGDARPDGHNAGNPGETGGDK